MHESDEAPPDDGIPHEPDAVDRAHAAELAVLLFLCPGLTTQELEALALRRKGSAKSGSHDPTTSEGNGRSRSESQDPARVEDEPSDDS